MLKKTVLPSSKAESENQEEWQILVTELLELDPWKFFKQPVPVYSQVRV